MVIMTLAPWPHAPSFKNCCLPAQEHHAALSERDLIWCSSSPTVRSPAAAFGGGAEEEEFLSILMRLPSSTALGWGFSSAICSQDPMLGRSQAVRYGVFEILEPQKQL